MLTILCPVYNIAVPVHEIIFCFSYHANYEPVGTALNGLTIPSVNFHIFHSRVFLLELDLGISPEIFNLENKTKMGNPYPRNFYLLFQQSRLGFKFEFGSGLNSWLFYRVRIWVIFELKFIKRN